MSHNYLGSFLDNDLYKFTMMQAAVKVAGLKEATYEFKCRTPSIDWRPYLRDVESAVYAMCDLHITDDELSYLDTLGLFEPVYLDTLRHFTYSPLAHVTMYCDTEHQLRIHIHGPWFLTILYEVPILSIVNQIYADSINPDSKVGENRLSQAIAARAFDREFKLVDFGTRRRRSLQWQDHVVGTWKKLDNFMGTSNVHLAMKHGIRPIGTMAHEWIMAGQGLYPYHNITLRESQSFMLQKWAEVYRGKLGIALSDTLGFDTFLKDFDGYFARLYDGCRQDSGEPIAWGKKLIAHYKSLGIKPFTKTAVFSDGLDVNTALDIFYELGSWINCVFGIGTKLTNDFDYPNGPLNIVIKLTEIANNPVAKISDSPSKGMCNDEGYLKNLRETFNLT